MRVLPRSVFGRMVLVLLGGLIAAQLVSFAIHSQERGELMMQTSGMRSAQRIADVVRLLDSVAPAERGKIVAVVDSPGLRVSLTRPLLPAAESDDRAAYFSAMLRYLLGADRLVAVRVSDAPAAWSRGPADAGGARGLGSGRGFGAGRGLGGGQGMMGGMMDRDGTMIGPGGGIGPGRGIGPRIWYVVQARLKDGTPVTFDTGQSPDAANWPYRLLLSLVVLLGAVLALTLFAVRWVTRPLKTLAEAAEQLGADINRPPLDEKGPLEVSRAARAFNDMQQRLAKFINDRTRILAAMSHDLKTPITRLRLRSELLDDPQIRAKFTKDLEEMESMVGATLDFMRGLESGEPVQPVDVMALLESMQEDMVEMGASVKIEGAAHLPYEGKPQALKRCLSDLLDNAVKYGKSATVAVDDDKSRLVITIRDEGPGIPERELEKVFDPFYRLETSRNRQTGGTGLGLTIARSIVENHGGKLVLRNHAEGGLEVGITLPRAVKSPPRA
jgi:signal transduction histidine kinase